MRESLSAMYLLVPIEAVVALVTLVMLISLEIDSS